MEPLLLDVIVKIVDHEKVEPKQLHDASVKLLKSTRSVQLRDLIQRILSQQAINRDGEITRRFKKGYQVEVVRVLRIAQEARGDGETLSKVLKVNGTALKTAQAYDSGFEADISSLGGDPLEELGEYAVTGPLVNEPEQRHVQSCSRPLESEDSGVEPDLDTD